MAEATTILPDFKKPPVVEVVCGVLVRPIEAMKAPHLGDFWTRVRTDFPHCEEQALLSPVVEVFGSPPSATIQFTDVPPLPRVWFISQRGDRLIQVQRDRFLFNWRRLEADDAYPHFDSVYGDFTKYLGVFRDFVAAIGGGALDAQQYELTYVNHIDGALIENAVSNLGRVFRDFTWAADSNRWLPMPADSTWRTTFVLPNQAGRLHSTVRLLVDDESHRRFIRFELTARGIRADKTIEGMKGWFETAHEWIVRGFADLTTPDLQREVWERIDV